jgi:hypothetical protein
MDAQIIPKVSTCLTEEWNRSKGPNFDGGHGCGGGSGDDDATIIYLLTYLVGCGTSALNLLLAEALYIRSPIISL